MSSGQGGRAAAGEAGERRGGRLDIDAARSRVGFRVRKMGLYFVKGRFRSIEGSVETDDDGAPKRGELTIDAASVTTRIPPRDSHLRRRDFLDVSDHPTISVLVESVRPGDEGFDATATFTIRGVSAPVELQGHLHGKQPVVLRLHGTLDRHTFGIRARRPFEWIVGREVRLDALVVLTNVRWRLTRRRSRRGGSRTRQRDGAAGA
jgi:polyisoprenoid-binding protein YceI